ncbi:Uncharacterized protein APZ42_031465 [Daphnia magna]|uniref:Uncharacterized protein n=1 Tax=Daphnia magna TaxID=35525 RepID=A0A164MU92_9CRUS|nr:Uncharacterized protein APZ42_031465 [Daphnia magna]
MDNIIGLEHYIRKGFNNINPKNTYTRNLLCNRTYNVKIGNTTSENRELKVGVPQGSPISPLLFSIMMDDFPSLPEPGQTLLFADDIEFHTYAKDGREAETKLTPYLDKCTEWSKKWRFKFSAQKSSLINFTRQRKDQTNPLLFIAGSKIPEVSEIKHFGVYFDKGLRWNKQTEAVISKNVKLKNLFKILGHTKHGPSTASLIIMYKALVRSRIDYGIMVFGTSSQSRQKKIEAIQNSMMRIILNAPQSTPIKEILLELDLQPLSVRKTWLSGRYLIRVEKQPNHPMFKPCQNLRRNPISWKDFNTPALYQATSHTIMANLNLFQEDKDQDSSLNEENKHTTYAAILPTLNIEETGSLAEGTSIFSAEAYAIHRAMELAYNHTGEMEELVIFTDSKLVVAALAYPDEGKNQVIQSITQTALNLKSSGTQTRICWIPSHVGIPGNERAESLASRQNLPEKSPTRAYNPLATSEQTAIFKQYLRKASLEELKKGSTKENITRRTHTGPIKWHQHKSRTITRILFRLRTGHNRLKAQLARLMPQQSPNCQECDEPETTEHALLDCPVLEMERLEIKKYFSNKHLKLDLPTLLGLNLDLNHSTQYEIQHGLVKYLKDTGLINRI